MEGYVRDARPGDIYTIERIERQCFSVPWTREQLERSMPDGMHELLVFDSAERGVIGYIGMMSVLDEGYISNVAVEPEQRRRGAGRELVAAMLRRAERKKLSFVTLEARAHNEPAIALYSSMGFVRVGVRRRYYERPTEDAVLMTYYFGEEKHEDTCV